MKIAEIFYSIQGEGILAGVPSVFVRASGCNLRCVWCDTPYTSWKPEGVERSVAQIVEAVRADSRGHVVITGGEPMMQPEIEDLTRALEAIGQHITVETAGTLWKPVACNLMSVSPKLANSTPWSVEEGRWAARHERLRYRPEVLRLLVERYEYQLKFVVQEPGDLEEIERIVSAAGADRGKVLLMPEGTSAAGLHARSLWIVDACKSRGFRYSPRLHVDLWGNRRGV